MTRFVEIGEDDRGRARLSLARLRTRTGFIRSAVLGLVVGCCALGVAGCVEGLEGFDEESQELPATPELLDGRVYAAPNAYILGHKLARSTQVKLAFKGSTLSASAGCRVARGPFSIRRGRLRAPDLTLTGKPCSPELSEQEAWLTDLLGGPLYADLASEEAHVLYIGDKKVSLEMGALNPDQPDQGRLRSEGWLLDRFEYARTPQATTVDIPVPGRSEYKKRTPFANSIPALSMFGGDKFDFSTPCGLIQGEFSFDEEMIEFQRNDESKESCDPRIDDFHSKVAHLFNGTFEYQLDGADLVLRKDGNVLRFFSG